VLANAWRRVSPDFLTYAKFAKLLLSVDQELSGGEFQSEMTESFVWRGIGEVSVGPRLPSPSSHSHAFSVRTLLPDADGKDKNMAETLLTPTGIKLFGRIVQDLTIAPSFNYGLSLGSNYFLRRQLEAASRVYIYTYAGTAIANDTVNYTVGGYTPSNPYTVRAGTNPDTWALEIYGDIVKNGSASYGAIVLGNNSPSQAQFIVYFGKGDATAPNVANTVTAAAGGTPSERVSVSAVYGDRFARIYALSFEGQFVELTKPTLFLVDGPGIPLLSTNPTLGSTDVSGVAARQWDFAWGIVDQSDVSYWEYDKGDFSIRLDVDTGPFEQILLEALIRSNPQTSVDFRGGMSLRSGMSLRLGELDPRNTR
jgi:hypothetical protein